MSKENSSFLFNTIAPIYGMFYNYQKRSFLRVLGKAGKKFDISSFSTALDVGCGTGALCSVLCQKGLLVTGIDPAEKMLKIAKRKTKNEGISFICANALTRLPFEDNSFDISFASYVAHGMQKNERKKLYAEMSRVTKHNVIIHDYNKNRSLLTSLIEWLEGGDYFEFVKNPKNEMNDCVSEMKRCFSQVKVIDVGTRASWYICNPSSETLKIQPTH